MRTMSSKTDACMGVSGPSVSFWEGPFSCRDIGSQGKRGISKKTRRPRNKGKDFFFLVACLSLCVTVRAGASRLRSGAVDQSGDEQGCGAGDRLPRGPPADGAIHPPWGLSSPGTGKEDPSFRPTIFFRKLDLLNETCYCWQTVETLDQVAESTVEHLIRKST